MERINLGKVTLTLLIFTTLAVFLCYYKIDRQTANWVYLHGYSTYRSLNNLTLIPGIFVLLASVFYIVMAIRFCLGYWSNLDLRLLMFSNTIAITQFLKDFFKILFGRYWPETWTNNNPSLIKDHLYGFHLVSFGDAYASFPSGHTAVVVAGATTIWLLIPRLRILAVLLILATAVGLVGSDYHFVGDVIAGGVLGYLVSIFYFEITKGNTLAYASKDTK